MVKQATMGAVKIEIEKIKNPQRLQQTLRKRKMGLMKKGHELGVLCNQRIAILVEDLETGRVILYDSSDEKIFPDSKYTMIRDEDRYRPEDFKKYYNKQSKNLSKSQSQSIQINKQVKNHLFSKSDQPMTNDQPNDADQPAIYDQPIQREQPMNDIPNYIEQLPTWDQQIHNDQAIINDMIHQKLERGVASFEQLLAMFKTSLP